MFSFAYLCTAGDVPKLMDKDILPQNKLLTHISKNDSRPIYATYFEAVPAAFVSLLHLVT